MLAVSYNPILLVGAALLAIIAGFTGLSLTNGLSRLDEARRKPAIVRAATILGGGVWSTHFVAMLAMRLPVEVVYDPVYTLTSALIAILMTGGALLMLHFGPRSPGRMALAGSVMGLGVVVMHYVGMYGMRGCEPVFGAAGYMISTVLAIAISIAAIRLAYGRRTLGGLILGGGAYGLAILVMHFSAMSQTGFLAVDQLAVSARLVPNDMLALLVVFAAFLICGTFLLTTVSIRRPVGHVPAPSKGLEQPPKTEAKVRLPYELDGRTFFTAIDDVVAIQAEGHYTRLHRPGGEVFCPVAITKLAEDLRGSSFMRTHRSYLVNMTYVEGFERRKDQGVCVFAPNLGIAPAPVSRSNLPTIKQALGL